MAPKNSWLCAIEFLKLGCTPATDCSGNNAKSGWVRGALGGVGTESRAPTRCPRGVSRSETPRQTHFAEDKSGGAGRKKKKMPDRNYAFTTRGLGAKAQQKASRHLSPMLVFFTNIRTKRCCAAHLSWCLRSLRLVFSKHDSIRDMLRLGTPHAPSRKPCEQFNEINWLPGSQLSFRLLVKNTNKGMRSRILMNSFTTRGLGTKTQLHQGGKTTWRCPTPLRIVSRYTGRCAVGDDAVIPSRIVLLRETMLDIKKNLNTKRFVYNAGSCYAEASRHLRGVRRLLS
jgi:hypothetical protein